MLKWNLRLNRHNTLYIILQALACLSLVERYEYFGEICYLKHQTVPYVVPWTLACFRLTRKNISVFLRTRREQYGFLYGSILSLCITALPCRETAAKSESLSISLKIDYSHSDAICSCVSQADSDGRASSCTESQTLHCHDQSTCFVFKRLYVRILFHRSEIVILSWLYAVPSHKCSNYYNIYTVRPKSFRTDFSKTLRHMTKTRTFFYSI
jgi:hypothetical protein